MPGFAAEIGNNITSNFGTEEKDLKIDNIFRNFKFYGNIHRNFFSIISCMDIKSRRYCWPINSKQ